MGLPSHGSNYVTDLLARAARNPAKVALIRGDRRLTYGELPAELARRVQAMQASGLAAGMRVGVVTRDPFEHLLVSTALASLGALSCAMDPSMDAGQRQEIAQIYGFDTLLESDDCASGSDRAIRMDSAWLAAGGPPWAGLQPAAPVMSAAAMNMTSGTTGTPTGVIWGHDWVRAFPRILADEGVFEEGMVWLSQMPHFIFVGSVPRSVLLVGGTVVLAPGIRSMEDLIGAVNANGITHMMVPPVVLAPLIQIARQKGVRPLFPQLRWLMIGGDVSDMTLLHAAVEWLTPGVLFAYGTTTAGVATFLRAPEFAAHAGSAGRAIGGVTVEIVDRNDRPVPPDVVGAIRVRGELTYDEVIGPKKFNGEELRDGFQYTGDVGLLDKDGYLHVLGRVSDIIERGGVELLPNRIERQLRACPGVREVTVAGVPDGAGGQVPVAFVVAEPGTDAQALTDFAQVHLEEAARPADYVFIDATPRNHLGKALRRELVARYLEGS